MGDLSDHFSRHEFACKCGCGMDTVDAELITVLEKVREAFGGKSIKINSSNRCPAHNAKVGGGVASQHLYSRAADIVITGVNPIGVYEWLDSSYPDQYGIGKYNDFTHIDTRGVKARWSKV